MNELIERLRGAISELEDCVDRVAYEGAEAYVTVGASQKLKNARKQLKEIIFEIGNKLEEGQGLQRKSV